MSVSVSQNSWAVCLLTFCETSFEFVELAPHLVQGRDTLKGGPHVVVKLGEKLCFIYLLQAGGRNLFTSFSRNLGFTF